MLLALARIPVASGGTLADRVAGINLSAYTAVSSELEIPSRACSVGSVNITEATQAALWAQAGYEGSQAITTYATILQSVMTDPALRNGAMILQNIVGGEKWSFPQPVGAGPVLAPILAAATAAWGDRYMISWNTVSELGELPPVVIIAEAQGGVPLALEFNATGTANTTSCGGIRPNGSMDPVTATPLCFQAMQLRNQAAVPSPVVMWQVPPADFGVPGFFNQVTPPIIVHP